MRPLKIKPLQYTVLFVLLLLIYGCGVTDLDDQISNHNYAAKEEFTYNFEADGKNKLEISAVNGTIQITGDPAVTVVKIEGERIVQSESKEDAQEHLKDLSVEITQYERSLAVQTKQPKKSDGRNYIINYRVRIPNTWSIAVENVNGNLTVDSLDNDVACDLVNGNCTLDEIKGDVYNSVVNGNIEGKLYLQQKGTFNISTVNGSIYISIPTSSNASFSSSVTNGFIQISNLPIETVKQTSKIVNGTLGEGAGNISLQTTNGNIKVSGF